jgi:DNA-binding transcriptional LysR family regulator
MITDLRKLRHVVGVAEAESFTGAGATLGVTQSALTKSVADVERHLDVSLFQRLPRGVRLTDAGEQFVQRARKILADMDDLSTGMDKLRDLRAGRLRLGVAPAAFLPLIDDPLAAFAKVYPAIQIEVSAGDVEARARALALGELDLVVGEANFLAQWPDIEAQAVYPLYHYFIARPDHPARQVAQLEAKDLLSYPIVVPSDRLPTDEELAHIYMDAGLPPRPPQYRCDGTALIRKWVLSTDAIAPLAAFRPPGAATREAFWVIEDVINLRPNVLGVATNRSPDQAPTVRAFQDMFSRFRGSDLL